MTKSKGVILIILCLIVLGLGLYSVGKITIIRYWGSKVEAVISQVPSECDKYNTIKVILNEEEYDITIAKSDCRDGVYKVGQKVVLMKHSNYRELVWPNSHPELVILLIIVVLTAGYFTAKKYYRK